MAVSQNKSEDEVRGKKMQKMKGPKLSPDMRMSNSDADLDQKMTAPLVHSCP